MATRCRSMARPAMNLLKSAAATTARSNIRPTASRTATFACPNSMRPQSQLGCLQSLLPLYSAVSSARLTSCLGIDSKGSRSLSQELGQCVPR
ncbi:protein NONRESPONDING TO OXYLIPINS 2, mitochondrial isoform X2 [Impatiens glandulifera]|uniref:protein NONRESPONDING TO OXYLIPINS 2, mitochondrial isoform X2 n=1 Tax=Impatiens glandulifera TaxID=253017 RepID=UPI001FB114E4|nr:protein NONRESPONDING TO OXYLIPINS 2, mitochondrial isoform X2 [Impatiens glandulifera]